MKIRSVASDTGDVHLRGETEDRDRPILANDQDHVVAVGGLDGNRVHGPVASAAGRRGKIEVDLGHNGAVEQHRVETVLAFESVVVVALVRRLRLPKPKPATEALDAAALSGR